MPKKWFRNLFAPKASSSPQRGLLVGDDETNRNNSKPQLKLGQRQSQLPQTPSHHKASTSSSSSPLSSSRGRSFFARWSFRRNNQQSQDAASAAVAATTTRNNTSSRTSAILCCWVCDMRVATIGFNLAHILFSTLLEILELWGWHSYSVFRPPPLLFFLALFFSIMGIFGAFYFHWTTMFLSTIGLIWLLVLYLSENHLFGVFLLGCILYCHILFMLEMKKGILSRADHQSRNYEPPPPPHKRITTTDQIIIWNKKDDVLLPLTLAAKKLLYDDATTEPTTTTTGNRDVEEIAATELVQDVTQHHDASALSSHPASSSPPTSNSDGAAGDGGSSNHNRSGRCVEEC